MALICAAAMTGVFGQRPATAQFSDVNPPWVGIPPVPNVPTASSRFDRGQSDPNAQMMVRADELQYDNANNRILAIGSVQIYYQGSTLEADRVVYEQTTKRMRAEGNARLTEADGKVIIGEIIDLTDQFRDGFVDSLQIETVDKTRFAAPRAERQGGRYTVFQSGVYTACEPCKDDPRKPPRWQVRATRIIHDDTEKMIYFEGARLEAFGFPLFYWPYLSTPDPTVKRKSGLLVPKFGYTSVLGVNYSQAYFWALAPNYDVTVTPTLSSKQGLLMQAEWRHRLLNGSYSIKTAGIFQADPGAFERRFTPVYPGDKDPGDRLFRGSIDTTGQFALNNNWVWGWDGSLVTDRMVIQDYALRTYFAVMDPFKSGGLETVSQLYLTGRGERSYFDARAMYFYGLAASDVQSQIPIIHPVVDYRNSLANPLFGGQLTYRGNLISLSREDAEFDPISQKAFNTGQCSSLSPDPALKARTDCILRGFPGTYSRGSAEATWRRTLIDPWGEKWTPFVSLRGDIAALSVQNETGVSNYLPTGDSTVGRFMPAVGVEYRYPFISVHSWGTQTIEPIAQLIVRPNETQIGKLPNEDAQSLIFDDSNLFSLNKFSGWDRIEGGTRLNAGIQYTAQFNNAGSVNAMFGQSYQLFGQNSFAIPDTVNTGLSSGLAKPRSDYVARLAYQPDSIYGVIARFLLDEETFTIRRVELEGRANFDRWQLQAMYGNYDAQPEIGFLTRRQGVTGQVTFKFTQNWSVLAAARYDLEASQLNQTRVGLGYIDDCFAISLNYISDFNYSGTTTTDNKVMLIVNLRTIGGTSFSQSANIGGTSGSGLF
ncbi:MAG: LPS-assembly protein LptD [Xanthobacteraceae bacterium]